MSNFESRTKQALRAIAKVMPKRIRNLIRNFFAELSGTREMRDFFRQYYGDFEVYNKLLKDKSDITEYHVDKVIRTIGDELVSLKLNNENLTKRVALLENATKGRNRKD